MIFNSRLETIIEKLFDRSKHREFRFNTFVAAKQPHRSMRVRWTSLGASLLVAACGSTVDPGKIDSPPSTTLSAAQPMITAGASSTLMWRSTNTTSCTASGGWSGWRPTSGSESTGALLVNTSFSLTCTRADGVSDVATATVTVAPAASVTLAANPTTVSPGAGSTLTWSSTNATSCTASGGWSGTKATSGSQSTGPLTATTTYSLRCTGAGGTSNVTTATVKVVSAATVTLAANPITVIRGASSTLTWSSTNATSCTASGGWSGTKATSGSQSTGPLTATTTYSLSCTGAGGVGNVATITVTVPGTPTVTLAATPSSIAHGGASTLTWSSTNATSCTASGGWSGTKATGGSQSTGPLTATTTYSLSCTGTGGTSNVTTATVKVVPSPTVALAANPTSVASGSASTLTWSSTNATSCTASGGWSGTKATSGSQSTGPLTATTTYSLSCTGVGGTSNVTTATVKVVPRATVNLAANPTSVASGSASTLTWSSTNATSCTASGGWSGTKATSGSQSTGPLTATTTYSLSCTGVGGTSNVTTATVKVVPRATVALAANPTSVASGSASTLTWSSTNATSCTASGGWSGTKATSGSQSTGPLTATTTYSLSCTGIGGVSNTAIATVKTVTGSVTLSPKTAALASSQTQQFTATVPGGGTASWTVDGVAGGNSAVGIINSTGLYTAGTAAGTHTVVASSVAAPTQTASATVAVTDLAGVYTYHNDLARDGANTHEYALTPANVNTSSFGKLTSCAVDGVINGQPLWVANLTVNGAKHNVVFVTTQHDSLYAFDADAVPCQQLWTVSLIDAAHGAQAGETTVPPNLFGAGGGDIAPEFGVTGAPVIDAASGLLYVVSMSVNSGHSAYYQRLHAINLTTGAEKTGSPATIAGTYPTAAGGTVTFDPHRQLQRTGLALVNGVVYVAFASQEDTGTWYGWMMGYPYNGASFTQTAVFNAAPNTREAGIWMSGGAPAADSGNDLYVVTGNGGFNPPSNDYGDSLLQLTPSLTVSQWFTPTNQANDNQRSGLRSRWRSAAR